MYILIKTKPPGLFSTQQDIGIVGPFTSLEDAVDAVQKLRDTGSLSASILGSESGTKELNKFLDSENMGTRPYGHRDSMLLFLDGISNPAVETMLVSLGIKKATPSKTSEPYDPEAILDVSVNPGNSDFENMSIDELEDLEEQEHEEGEEDQDEGEGDSSQETFEEVPDEHVNDDHAYYIVRQSYVEGVAEFHPLTATLDADDNITLVPSLPPDSYPLDVAMEYAKKYSESLVKDDELLILVVENYDWQKAKTETPENTVAIYSVSGSGLPNRPGEDSAEPHYIIARVNELGHVEYITGLGDGGENHDLGSDRDLALKYKIVEGADGGEVRLSFPLKSHLAGNEEDTISE